MKKTQISPSLVQPFARSGNKTGNQSTRLKQDVTSDEADDDMLCLWAFCMMNMPENSPFALAL